jgi:succinoglycan biosynthesis transport protein ExoP
LQDPPHRSESSKPWRDADAFAGANPRFDARANAQRDAHAGGLSISEAGPVANGLSGPSVSLRALFAVVWRRRLLVLATLGCLLLPCLAYCLIAPNQYEASARVALRTTPASALSLEATGPLATASILSAPLQQETLANYLRSEQLAWRVIASLKLYQAAGFNGSFARRFPGFKPGEATQAGGEMSGPGAEDLAAEAYLLDRFRKRLLVETVPRSLVILIRFRSHDAALSAAVVNELIEVYREQDSETHMRATAEESRWLSGQLRGLKVDVDARQKRLSQFQRKHGLLSSTDTLTNGQPAETEHNATLLEIDELGRQLVAATTERMVREAEYHAATEGDPELVLAQNTELQGVDGTPMAVLKTIHAHAGELGLERAQLSAEHGPNFPRVVEIRKELEELTAQRTAQDADLVTWFRTGMQTATDHERLVKQSLEAKTLEGMKLNEAQTEYAVMRQEADSSHDLYMRVQGKVAEAALAAGVESPNISVVDYARPPVKAVAPDLPVYMAITFFIGLWLAVGVALLVESTGREGARAAVAVAGLVLMAATARSQAPTPNLDGLPAGVARLPLTQDTTPTPAVEWIGCPAGRDARVSRRRGCRTGRRDVGGCDVGGRDLDDGCADQRGGLHRGDRVAYAGVSYVGAGGRGWHGAAADGE